MPKKLVDYKDIHGTTLQSYAEDLMEKADSAGLYCIFIFAGEPDLLQSISNVPIQQQPVIFEKLAKQIRENKQKGSAQLLKRTDVEN